MKKKCPRCGADLHKVPSTMSYFNTETICIVCQSLERMHPKYPEARAAEEAAVQMGNYNFPGIGRPSDL